jgi:hypothetical protein
MKRIPKEDIYKACIARQEELIKNFTGEIEQVEKEMNDRDNMPSQTDHNPAAEQLAMYNELKKELEFLKYEMHVLENLNLEKEYTEVEPGAVVVTDKRVLFVCVSIEEVEVGGHKVFGLSTEAPIYARMRGKKKGEEFKMRDITYKILDLY